MGRPLRMWMKDAVYLVTNRTIEQRYWLKPTPEMHALFGFWLARSVERFNIHLYAALLMSNHPHLVVRAPDGNLSAFMEYFQLNLTKAVNRMHGRSGPLWQRRFSAEPILDEPARWDKMGYVLANPVAANLVARAHEWPGFSTLEDVGRKTPRMFTGLDRTAWIQAGKPQKPEEKAAYTRTYPLILTPLLGSESLSAKAYRARALCSVRKHETQARELRQETKKKVLPRQRLMALRAWQRPKTPKRSPRPLCHTSEDTLAEAFKEIWQAFLVAYREVAEAYKAGFVKKEFPPGSFPPACFPKACYAPHK